MKILMIILVSIFTSGNDKIECGDGITYANKKQTEFDKRLSNIPKIQDVPTYNGGTSEFKKFIEENLKVTEKGKGSIFRANYMFTITCDEQLKDIKVLGDTTLKK